MAEPARDVDTLFAPQDISVLLLLSASEEIAGRIDLRVKVNLRDECSALLLLYDGSSGNETASYVLDLIANLSKECEVVDSCGALTSVIYRYSRMERQIDFEVIPTSEQGAREVQAFDFILGQYAIKEEQEYARGVQSPEHEPNLLAQGFENTGVAARVMLRSGGRATGDAIRFMGKAYTYVVAPLQPPPPPHPPATGTAADTVTADHSATATASTTAVPASSDAGATGTAVANVKAGSDADAEVGGAVEGAAGARNSRVFTKEDVDRARSHQQWAEGVHSGAATLTGAVLYPVRWTGRMASRFGRGGADRPPQEGPIFRALLDTIGGVGNGMMSVCKGLTEAVGEVGTAIGDSAMHHSRAVNGDEYAHAVTQIWVDAGAELGLAGYKVANVAALGWQGVIVNAALEGSTFVVALQEYLRGPVLMQGYMEMRQQPLTQKDHLFVVLRPWSLAFYHSAAELTQKPYKLVPCSMLDTLPKLRTSRPDTTSNFAAVAETEAEAEAEAGVKSERPEGAVEGKEVEGAVLERCEGEGAAGLGGEGCGAREGDAVVPDSVPVPVRSSIELCTVDCSTFQLFPPEAVIQAWYRELTAATLRVETIAKRKSGADEMALLRRLGMFPTAQLLTVRVRRFIRTVPRKPLFDLSAFGRVQGFYSPTKGDDSELEALALAQAQMQAQAVAQAQEGAGAGEGGLDLLEDEEGVAGGSQTDASECSDDSLYPDGEEELMGYDGVVVEEVGEAEVEGGAEEQGGAYLSGSYTEITAVDALADAADATSERPAETLSLQPPATSASASAASAASAFAASASATSATSASAASPATPLTPPSTPPAPVTPIVRRPFFIAELRCSVLPVTRSGIRISCEKHRVERVPLMSVQQYRQELRRLIDLAQGGTATGVTAQGVARLSLLRKNLALYAQVNGEKLISDWDVFYADAGAGMGAGEGAGTEEDKGEGAGAGHEKVGDKEGDREGSGEKGEEERVGEGVCDDYVLGGGQTVQIGHKANVLATTDVTRVEIKFSRRSAHLAHFVEWGVGELELEDLPPLPPRAGAGAEADVGGVGAVGVSVRAGAGTDDLGGVSRDVWVPVLRRRTREQLGVALVTVARVPTVGK